MVELNGGQQPPLHLRKKLFPKVFGGGQSWYVGSPTCSLFSPYTSLFFRNLALPISQIFNSLASRGWRLVSSSAAAGTTTPPAAENGTQPMDRRYHIFIFINTSDASSDDITPRSGSASPRSTPRGSTINPYIPPAPPAGGGST
jgi:hypothetical protein